MPSAPIPQAIQRTPQRGLGDYTVDSPDTKPDLTTAATSTNFGSLQTTPRVAVVVDVDTQMATGVLTGIAAGASTTVTITVPFPRISTPFTPNLPDEVYFQASLSRLTHNVAATVVVGQWNVTPQAYSGSTAYPGPTLSTSLQYNSFNAVVVVTFVNVGVGASSAGTVTIRMDARLYDLPG